MRLLTVEVSRATGFTLYQIQEAMRGGKLTRPAKDASGRFVWTEADVEALKKAVATDRRKLRRAGRRSCGAA